MLKFYQYLSPRRADAVKSHSLAALSSTQFSCFKFRTVYAKILCLIGLTLSANLASASVSKDLLQQPAIQSARAVHSLMLDVVNTGKRLVAVGERGHILYSDDQGEQWLQAGVPAMVTLNAVHFATPDLGWAVGHDGLVLHTRDGGVSWRKQLDGYQISEMLLAYGQSRVSELEQAVASAEDSDTREEAELALEDAIYLVEESQQSLQEGPSKPLQDVWFGDRLNGFVVGAYGVILRTSDGGQSWQPWLDRIDNPQGLHYYGITAIDAKTLFIAGEAGTLYRSIDGGASWKTLESPYGGTYFGLVASPRQAAIVVFGLRGNLYRSADLGQTWLRANSNTQSSLAGGVALANGAVVIVGHGGAVVQGRAETEQLSVHVRQDRRSYSAVAETTDGNLVLAGQGGLRLVMSNGSDRESK